MSKQLSLFSYMPKPKRRCISTTTSTTEPEDETEASRLMDNVIDQQVQQQSTDIVEMNAAVNVEPEIASTCSSSICSSTSTSTALDDISLTPHSAPIQPNNVTFPKRSYTDRGRSFNPSWFSQYNWLEYSVKRDAAFCFPCRWFGASGIGRSRPEKTFTITGFRDWKHATGNKGVLFCHSNSLSHKNCVVAWDQSRCTSVSGTVSEQLGNKRSEMIERNRHYITAVSDILLTCCKMEIALRGHREAVDSLNRGNFIEILLLLSRYDHVIQDRLQKGPRNALYTSHDIQNTIIHIMGQIVRQKISNDIQRAGYYSLLVDETKDISKKEQMSFVIRYVDPVSSNIAERFLTFIIAPNLTAEHLTQYIVDTLSLYNINLSSMVSQGYDGASVMSGCISGVQKRIRDLVPQACYIHCHAHCLNLVLVDCAKSIARVSEFFSLLQSLYIFISSSKAHTLFIKSQLELHPKQRTRELQKLCETRWACKFNSLDVISATFDSILLTLDTIRDDSDKAKAVEAAGLYHHVHSFSFISCLIILHRIMGITKSLSDQLQSKELDLAAASDLVISTIDTLRKFRSDEAWDRTFNHITDVAKLHDIETEERRRRKRPQRQVTDFISNSTQGYRDPLNSSQSLKVAVYFPVLDHIISEMERRFSSTQLSIMKALQSCNPHSAHFLEVSEINEMASFYSLNTDLLSNECTLAKSTLRGKDLDKGITSVYKHLVPLSSAFPTLIKVLKIALTLAVSSAQCERSFSALKRIKTYLRTTMSEERLSDMSLLSIEKDLSNEISFDDVLERFESGDKNRTIILS